MLRQETMKYGNKIEINLPLEQMIEKFDNPNNLKKWMPGLLSFEHLSGDPGQTGAKSKLKFQMGKRQMEMVETITVRNLPHEFSGTYEAPGVFNIVKNKFKSLPGNKTEWHAENEFQFKNLTMKIMGFLMPGMFKKQSMVYLTKFKEFAEGNSSN